MNYSAFEQAAAEANLGAVEVDSQLEQLRAQMEQLKSKRDLLRGLSHQLSILRSNGSTAPAAAIPFEVERPAAAEAPKAEPAAKPDIEAEMAAASATSTRSLRQEWGSLGSDAGSGDSSIWSRL